MLIRTLQVENFRNLRAVTLDAHPRLNVLFGDNGAGKTSVLEAIVVLSRGRSFRTTQTSDLVGPAEPTFRVFAQTEGPRAASHRLGLERSGRRWRGRMDGRDLSQLSELTRSLPLVLMEPDSHLLVSGSPDVRRKYIDWAMFHVEQGFLDLWRRYALALRQRNAALRAQKAEVVESLDEILVRDGQNLHLRRAEHCSKLARRLQPMLRDLGAERIGDIVLNYSPGWPGESLGEALADAWRRDRERGQTSVGPHRADLDLKVGGVPARAVLSRGEQKMLAAALLFSQWELLASEGEQPLLLLDDLASEFDQERFRRVLARAGSTGAQVWLTGTRRPEPGTASAMFHVERGSVAKVV